MDKLEKDVYEAFLKHMLDGAEHGHSNIPDHAGAFLKFCQGVATLHSSERDGKLLPHQIKALDRQK